MPSVIPSKGEKDQSRDSGREGASEQRRTYHFSTVIVLVFMLGMVMVSLLTIMASYWGVRDVVQYNIARLSDRTALIARLVFHDYLRPARHTTDIVVTSDSLGDAIMDADITRQRGILSEIYSVREEGQLDLFFLQIGYDGQIVDVSAAAYDTRVLRNALLQVPHARFWNVLVVSEGQEGPPLYAIGNKEPVLSDTGKVLGHVYTGIILNDNIEILSGVLAGTQANVLNLVYRMRLVSTLAREEAERIALEPEEADHFHIIADMEVSSLSGEPLILHIEHPLRTMRLLEKRYVQAIYNAIIFIVLIIILSVVLLNRVVHKAIFSLTDYVVAVRKDRSRACFKGSAIAEFDDVGRTLDHLVGEMVAAEQKILRSNDELKHLAHVAARSKERLRKANRDLAHANAELEEFAYRTSHDLRAPLVSSLSLLGMVANSIKAGDTDMALESLSYMQKILDQLEILIRDILILNEARHKEEGRQKIDIEELIDESLKRLAYIEGFNRIEIIKKLPFKGPLYSKKTRVQMIIDNLLSNAVKYHDLEKDRPYIEISTRRRKDNFVLRVKDNGSGIPPGKEDKLFDMFQRFHPRRSFGSGIGLYLVKKAALSLHGEIYFKRHKEGSIFELVIPLDSPSLTEEPNEQEGAEL